MMRMLRFVGRVFALSLQRELAHRANLLFALLSAAMGFAAGAGTLAAVFSRVDGLAGWGAAEAMLLLGIYETTTGLLQTFVEPNLAWFAERLTRGELDEFLLQPLPSLLSLSLGTCRPLSLTRVALGLAVTGAGVARLSSLSAERVAAFLLLFLAGLVIAWASRVLLATLAFWAPGLEPSVLYWAFWNLGRYPSAIYPAAVRQLLTFVVPVAAIAAIPAAALGRGAALWQVGALLGAAAGAAALVVAVWQAGVRRYTGTTS